MALKPGCQRMFLTLRTGWRPNVTVNIGRGIAIKVVKNGPRRGCQNSMYCWRKGELLGYQDMSLERTVVCGRVKCVI